MTGIIRSASLMACFMASGIHAQTCPPSIETDPTKAKELVEWTWSDLDKEGNSRTIVGAGPDLTRSHGAPLLGVTIADMHVEEDGKSAEYELRPMEDKSGLVYWQFNLEVGENAVMMTCLYLGTSVRLSKLAAADVVECFQKRIKGPGGKKVRQVVAMCVNARERSQMALHRGNPRQ